LRGNGTEPVQDTVARMVKAQTEVVHIIDDDPHVRDSLALILNVSGFHTRAWASGDQFLAEQPIGPNDMILIDMIMPGDNGLAVIHALRSKKLFNPVILMTGDSTPALQQRAFANHFALLPKPFSRESLLHMIDQVRLGEP
jgi:two-component system, LuxR family, response regulator FixJ